MSVGIVTGLVAEARIAQPLGIVLAGGGSTEEAARAATRLADDGATFLLSFGLAGGLSPSLTAGTIVVPGRVLADDAAFMCDAALLAWIGGITAPSLLASPSVVARAADKHAIWQRTGAVAVDMESGAVASVSRARGLPFAVLRAICDTAATDLPPAALVALNARGAIGLGRVAAALLRDLGQLPALLHLALQASAARKALLRHVAGMRARGTAPGL